MSFKPPVLFTAALVMTATAALAETTVTRTTTTIQETTPVVTPVTTTTIVTPVGIPVIATRTLVFNEFDMNKDGILSAHEVSDMLFNFYDTDKNDGLSEEEYNTKNIVTVTPAESKTVITYDYDNDGIADKTQYTYETFLHSTYLDRYIGNTSGLSAHEVLDRQFKIVDSNKNGEVSRSEWRAAYVDGMPRLNK